MLNSFKYQIINNYHKMKTLKIITILKQIVLLLNLKGRINHMNNRFINLYRNLNLISQDGNGLPIHRFCTNAAKCWEGSDERFPPDD